MLLSASLLLLAPTGCGGGHRRTVVVTKSPRHPAPVVVSRSPGHPPARKHEPLEHKSAQRKAQPSQSGNGKKLGHQKNPAHANSANAQKKAQPSQSANGKKLGHHKGVAPADGPAAKKQASQGQSKKNDHDKPGDKRKEEHCHSPGQGKGHNGKSVCHRPSNAVASRGH